MKPTVAVAALGLALETVAITAQAQTITIPTVTIGDAGNAADPLTGYGAVSYEFAIGKYEVTIGQYTAFLNAVAATDTYSLYNTNMASDLNIAGILRSGNSGFYTYSVMNNSGNSANRPITYVNWFDAARFANWVANGQPTGAQGNSTTENGAYSLLGATSGVGISKNTINPNTGTSTTWWIPSEDESYKAAYYDPSPSGPSDDYWLYATRSDSAPGNTIGAGANQANGPYAGLYAVTQSSSYNSSQNYLTDGGAFSASRSYYGTFDQSGNVYEWIDAVSGSTRGIRGDSWVNDGFHLHSSFRLFNDPTNENYGIGFRIANVPEPSTAVLILLGGAGLMLWRRRRVLP